MFIMFEIPWIGYAHGKLLIKKHKFQAHGGMPLIMAKVSSFFPKEGIKYWISIQRRQNIRLIHKIFKSPVCQFWTVQKHLQIVKFFKNQLPPTSNPNSVLFPAFLLFRVPIPLVHFYGFNLNECFLISCLQSCQSEKYLYYMRLAVPELSHHYNTTSLSSLPLITQLVIRTCRKPSATFVTALYTRAYWWYLLVLQLYKDLQTGTSWRLFLID